jgi:lipopolysaccharide biosynthesis protein
VKIISFYLPQYHPIPENDQWWGKGFTEWVSVAKARPRFRGHHQPQIPADLGFYDLRLEETRIAQAELAAEYGISGFCYYHYWFNGKMLLDRPFNEVLRSGKPDFPFCLCWANESWTRAWDGLEKEILIKQEYGARDRIEHIQWLCKAFKDPRYIKVNNKPLLLIYRTDAIPDLKERIQDWRRSVKEHGFSDLYLCAVKSNFSQMSEPEMIKTGFDAVVEFQPHSKDFPRRSPWVLLKLAFNHYINKIITGLNLQSSVPLLNENNILSYGKLTANAMAVPHPSDYIKFPCVTPTWDNSARKNVAQIIQNDNPDQFSDWILNALRRVEKYGDDEKIVFINAWNEWAEGCHLEPDVKNGRKFLEAVRYALKTHARNMFEKKD